MINGIDIIRYEKHLQFLKYKYEQKILQDRLKIDELKEKKLIILNHLSLKYDRFFNSKSPDIAAIRIQNFVKKSWFAYKCINEKDLITIPGIYRFRLYITEHHLMSENNIIQNNEECKILFRYCFNIQQLYPIRHSSIVIINPGDSLKNYNIYLQKRDLTRIEKAWSKVNNITTLSINFLNDMEYDKSLCKDQFADEIREKNRKNLNRIRNILNNEEDIIFNTSNWKLDIEYLENITRDYFSAILSVGDSPKDKLI